MEHILLFYFNLVNKFISILQYTFRYFAEIFSDYFIIL